MIDRLESIDRAIVSSINSWHTPFFDEFFWIISEKLTWLPLYLLLIFLYYKGNGVKKSIVFLICAIVVVTITDQLTVHLFKNVFMRYRPSHHAELSKSLHFYVFENGEVYKGGMYGFISSHAANFFGVCFYAALCLKQQFRRIAYPLLGIAVIVSFSRIYLGVHYLSDLLLGAVFGVIVAFLIYRYLYTYLITISSDK